MGSFGSKKPHSIFAGVTPAPEMHALQAEIERICQRLGLPADPRKFTPHVTLARLRNARTEDVAHYLSGRGNFHTAPFTVNRFVLMSSKESVGGGPYVTEEVFPLTEARGAGEAAELHGHPV
jgi:2'-5' RNA ligase